MIRRYTALLIIVLALCAVLCACGDEQSETPAADGALTAVKDGDGAIVGYERRYHNDNGDITRLDIYDADQTYLNYVLYEYDDAGLLFTETYYTANGIAQSRTLYTYDEDGRLYEKSYEYPHGDATVERYNADGEIVEKRYYDTDEQLSYTERLEDGKWVKCDPTEPPATEAATE